MNKYKRDIKYKGVNELYYIVTRDLQIVTVIGYKQVIKFFNLNEGMFPSRVSFNVRSLHVQNEHYIALCEEDYINQGKLKEFVKSTKPLTILYEPVSIQGKQYYKAINSGVVVDQASIGLIGNSLCHSDDGYYKSRKKFVHRIIMNPPKGMVVDHINGNPLDNRRCNLRICTQSQNTWNRKVNNTSKYVKKSSYKGVNKRKENGKFILEMYFKGQRIRKVLRDETRCAVFYDIISIALKGDFANTNFPLENYNNILVERFKSLYLKNIT